MHRLLPYNPEVNGMKIYDVQTEYRNNPKGLSVRIPRFSWKLESDRKNTVQAAYTLRVSCGNQTVWDSGRTETDQSVLVPYAGEPLMPEERYEVELWQWKITMEISAKQAHGLKQAYWMPGHSAQR